MKNLKKILIFILITTLILPAFSACGEKKTPLDVTLTLWNYYNDTQQRAFNLYIDEFNSTVGLQEGIVITAESKGTDTYAYAQNLIDSARGELGAEAFPDIFLTYSDTAKAIDAFGKIAALDEYFTTAEINEYVSAFLDEGRIDSSNGLKIFPTAKSTEVLMLNKTDWDAFAAANSGVTLSKLETMEGLLEVSEKYYEWSGGKAFYGRDSLANYFIIGAKQLGVELFTANADGSLKIDLNETMIRKLWDNYYVPFLKGHFFAQGKFRTDDLQPGHILAAVGSSAGVSYIPSKVGSGQAEHSVEFIVMETPYFSGEAKYAFQQGAGFSVANNDNKNKLKAAAIFLKWFTERERNTEFAMQSSYLPVKKEALQSDKIEEAIASRDKLTEAGKQTLRVCAGMINSGKMYVNGAFPEGNDIRKVFENSFDALKLRTLRAEIVEAAKTRPESEVLAEYIGNDSFTAWYNALCTSLANYI